jgi:hypothetical protein
MQDLSKLSRRAVASNDKREGAESPSHPQEDIKMNTRINKIADELHAETAASLRELQETIDRMYTHLAPQPISRRERLTRWMNSHPLPAWIAVSVIGGVTGNALFYGVDWFVKMVMP